MTALDSGAGAGESDPDPEGPAVLTVPVPPIGEPRAEAALLGCLLAMPPAPARGLLARLAESDWTLPAHRAVAAAVRGCLTAGIPADPVTVLGWLRRHGHEHATIRDGDLGPFLLQLLAAAPCIASGDYYAQVVLEHAYRARLQAAALRLLDGAHRHPLDALHALHTAETAAVATAFARLTPPPPATPADSRPVRRRPSTGTPTPARPTTRPARPGRTA